ncbi:MAG: hypothetical protein MJ252_01340 [archaeon]|nr:hypothetical protein [archaeon]
MVTFAEDTPGPKYTPADEEQYKFRFAPKWTIGNGLRPPLYDGQKYEYYKFAYDKDSDFGVMPKKWNKKPGGAFGTEVRMKLDLTEGTPGPGRYEPRLTQTKPRNLAYIFGEKTDSLSLKLLTGTNNKVGPGTYYPEKARNNSRHRFSPKWRFGTENYKGMANTVWTKHETYEEYSSVGNQVRSRKRSEPQINMTRGTRDGEKKRGIFPTMMENRPTKIRIELPKF